MSSPASGVGEGKGNETMRQGLTEQQTIILEAIRSEMSSGKSLEEAVREVIKSKMFNHMTVRRCADKLARDLDLLDRWRREL